MEGQASQKRKSQEGAEFDSLLDLVNHIATPNTVPGPLRFRGRSKNYSMEECQCHLAKPIIKSYMSSLTKSII